MNRLHAVIETVARLLVDGHIELNGTFNAMSYDDINVEQCLCYIYLLWCWNDELIDVNCEFPKWSKRRLMGELDRIVKHLACENFLEGRHMRSLKLSVVCAKLLDSLKTAPSIFEMFGFTKNRFEQEQLSRLLRFFGREKEKVKEFNESVQPDQVQELLELQELKQEDAQEQEQEVVTEHALEALQALEQEQREQVQKADKQKKLMRRAVELSESLAHIKSQLKSQEEDIREDELRKQEKQERQEKDDKMAVWSQQKRQLYQEHNALDEQIKRYEEQITELIDVEMGEKTYQQKLMKFEAELNIATQMIYESSSDSDDLEQVMRAQVDLEMLQDRIRGLKEQLQRIDAFKHAFETLHPDQTFNVSSELMHLVHARENLFDKSKVIYSQIHILERNVPDSGTDSGFGPGFASQRTLSGPVA